MIKGDINMHVGSIERKGMFFYDVTKKPFELTGFPWIHENNNFNRVPERIMPELPEMLAWVARQPSGGMIRFKTDSKRISIDVELLRNETSRNCTQALLSGFDVYMDVGEGYEFLCNLCPENNPMSYSVDVPCQLAGEIKSFLIYTPLQNPIKTIKIGLDEHANIEKPGIFAIKNPILFYGSSITCGFCASRPGLTYPARITRDLNANLINFGFGGSAKGEIVIARAINELELSCLVMDYDFNAPDNEHLENTHRAFYEEIRQAKPDLPIIMISAPYYHKAPNYFAQRQKIIENSYKFALKNGDKKIIYINGGLFFDKKEWANFTSDLIHPNDMGFERMAKLILPFVKQILL